jgi:hypothetical protein
MSLESDRFQYAVCFAVVGTIGLPGLGTEIKAIHRAFICGKTLTGW